MHERASMIRMLGPVGVAALSLLLAACAASLPIHAPDRVLPVPGSGGTVLAFDPSATRLAVGALDGWVRVWTLPAAVPRSAWRAQTGSVTGIGFLAGELVTAGYDGGLARWHPDGTLLQRVTVGAAITALVVDADDRRLATAGRDGTVRYWRLAGLVPLAVRRVPGGGIRALAWQGVGGATAAATRAGAVYLWTGNGALRSLQRPPTAAWALAFAPDGRWLEGAGWFKLYRWNLATGRLSVLSTPHRGLIRSIQFSADGRRLASVSRRTDSAVYLLDPRDGRPLERFRRHALCGSAVRISPDGRWLASTSDDQTVQLWRLAPPGAPGAVSR